MSERANLAAKTPEAKRDNSSSQTEKINFPQSINSPIDQILFLQRTVGNQAVQGLLKSGVIQAKLSIGRPGDIYEQEVDRVAEQVMRMPDLSESQSKRVSEDNKFPSIQRMCTDCEEELHRKTDEIQIQRICTECDEKVQRQDYLNIPSQSSQSQGQTPPGREPTREERESYGGLFPNLTEFRILRGPDNGYNCFAWAVGDDSRIITSGKLEEAGYSPGHELPAWTRYLSDQHGFVWHADGTDESADLVLFGESEHWIHHAARKADQPFGRMTFSSKMGGGETKTPVILHALRDLEGGGYGKALRSFWRASEPVKQVEGNYIQRMCSECEEELHRQPMEEGPFHNVGAASSRERSRQACPERSRRDGARTSIYDHGLMLQREPMEQDETLQTKGSSRESPEVSPSVESQINSIRGGGESLPESIRAFFEPRFREDFSGVRVHTDSKANESAKAVNALAYTMGQDVVFGSGQYAPETESGKKLIAHELSHVVQQNRGSVKLQRQHVPDTGFRYTPPETVKRSIFEIQRIVGTTADGVYGENTRIAVEKYQTELKAVGFYSDVLDGKWGKNTEAAHVAFATAPNTKREGYNCAGFAFKDYEKHSLAATKAIYSTMTQLSSCSDSCRPFQHKFWFWEFEWQGTQPKTNVILDFHTVGGQTNSKGKGPRQVMSKDGQRPVEGPNPPLDWEPKSGPGIDQITGKPIPNTHREVSNVELKCYCNDELP